MLDRQVMRFAIASLLLCSAAYGQFQEVFTKVAAYAEAERKQKKIPTIAVALVVDQNTIWQHVSGEGTPESVFRAGSVSKLFTDIAVMQMIEQGKVNLDQPVQKYLPDFNPRNPYQRSLTLRQLMSHRSGLVREPPRGHYFDDSSPNLAGTIRSLNDTELVYEPGTKTKYSNAGIAVAGRVVEVLSGRTFAGQLRRTILDPLQMASSDFYLTDTLKPRLSKAFMWTYDGRMFRAPQFELGISPAGSLYTTTGDLARFISCLFRQGAPLLESQTLAKMWEPQFGSNYGLGFRLDRLDGMRTVSHGGAIYGFATDLTAIPIDKIGAVTMVNMDSANSVATRISHQALRWMRQARRGEALEEVRVTEPLTEKEAQAWEGRYGDGDQTIQLTARKDKLYLTELRGGPRLEMRKQGEDLITDDLHGYGLRLRPREDGMQAGPDLLASKGFPKPAPSPADFQPFLGEYGWDHDVLYVMERGGKLTVLIEWYDYYPLERVRENVFRFPEFGLYENETLTFTSEGAIVGGVLFPKRKSLATSEVFRITPLKPVAELERAALAAQPPVEKGEFREPDLVELQKLDKKIRYDIRYATSDNFLSVPVYKQPHAFMQKPAAEALVRAHKELNLQGYGLLIHDAYRPWYVTKIFWDATPDDKHIFVADPSKGSMHNRGCAVDLTLYDLATGKAVEMTGGYDEMSERSFPDYPGGTALARFHRDLLRRVMERQGFRVFEFEWWHFDFQDWAKYTIQNLTFDSIRKKR